LGFFQINLLRKHAKYLTAFTLDEYFVHFVNIIDDETFLTKTSDEKYGKGGETGLVLAPRLPVLKEVSRSEIVPYTTSTTDDIEEIVMSQCDNFHISIYLCAQKVRKKLI
jgi:hypothetical protein